MTPETQASQCEFDKDNPFPAKIVENRLLNGEGSAKETRHFIVDLEGSGLTYTCGDSLGVYPTNNPGQVEAILKTQDWSGDETVQLPKDDAPITIREALLKRLAIGDQSKKFLQDLLEKSGDCPAKTEAEALLDPSNREELKAYLEQRHLIDYLENFSDIKWEPQDLVGQMKRLVPRLYSIASSPTRSPNATHLTVAIVRYETLGKAREGVCSTFIADRVILNAPEVPVFIASSHFGIPEEDSADVIMVGPGTGIAPFRAFLQEREDRKCSGRNWLFFGDQHANTDYLYGDEFEAWKDSGFLQNLSLAFSRDQDEKVYVQHRMLEQGKELWDWLNAGAYFYVCGDASRMAKDVDDALAQIGQDHGGMSEDESKSWLKQLRKEKRYQRDVY
jgi:sulfite reductase (NADPH) flavoprotein alpha-component